MLQQPCVSGQAESKGRSAQAMTGDFRSLRLQRKVPTSQTSTCKTYRSPAQMPPGQRPHVGGQASVGSSREAAFAPRTPAFGVVCSTCSPERTYTAVQRSSQPAGLTAERQCYLSCCHFLAVFPLCSLNGCCAGLPPAAERKVFFSSPPLFPFLPIKVLDAPHFPLILRLAFQYLQICPTKRLNIPCWIKCIYAELLGSLKSTHY